MKVPTDTLVVLSIFDTHSAHVLVSLAHVDVIVLQSSAMFTFAVFVSEGADGFGVLIILKMFYLILTLAPESKEITVSLPLSSADDGRGIM